jgi:Ca2+-binding EF-hand superfamily protein
MFNRHPQPVSHSPVVPFGGVMPGGTPMPVSRIIFNKYDRDHSGHISATEFHDLCYDMGHYLSREEIIQAVKMLDKDGCGKISYEEFLGWWRRDDRFKSLQLNEEAQKVLHQCACYFRHFDSDHSGTLSVAEFRSCHSDLVHNGCTNKPFDVVWREIDQDQSGKVCYNEYIQWLVRNHLLFIKPAGS